MSEILKPLQTKLALGIADHALGNFVLNEHDAKLKYQRTRRLWSEMVTIAAGGLAACTKADQFLQYTIGTQPANPDQAKKLQATAQALGLEQLKNPQEYTLFVLNVGATSLGDFTVSPLVTNAGGQILTNDTRELFVLAVPIQLLTGLTINPMIVKDMVEPQQVLVNGKWVDLTPQEAATLRSGNVKLLLNGSLVDAKGNVLLEMQKIDINLNDYYSLARTDSNLCQPHDPRLIGQSIQERAVHVDKEQTQFILDTFKAFEKMGLDPMVIVQGSIENFVAGLTDEQVITLLNATHTTLYKEIARNRVVLSGNLSFIDQMAEENYLGFCQFFDVRGINQQEVSTLDKILKRIYEAWNKINAGKPISLQLSPNFFRS